MNDEHEQTVSAAEPEQEGASTAMPRYLCHKRVWALKIRDISYPSLPDNETDGSLLIHPVEAGFKPIRVDREYVRKHGPHVGGYYVVYDDGHRSFSPAEAFEDGYLRI